MSAAAMANWAAGNSGVGPGVNKRVLRIMSSSPRISTKELLRAAAITEYTILWIMWTFSVNISAQSPNPPVLPENRYNSSLGGLQSSPNLKRSGRNSMTDAGALEAIISQQIVTAMKAHDSVRTGTLRLIKNALKNKAIEKRAPLTSAEEQQALATMIKQRRD